MPAHAEVRHFDADLRDADAIETMMAAIAGWAPLDVLVNNAGIQHAVPIAEMPVEKWNDIIAINLSAAFHTMRAGAAGHGASAASAAWSTSPRCTDWWPR